MADSAIGSALIIPESLLKDLDKADKKIQQIAIQSEETAKAFNTSFEGMALSVEKLINALQTANTNIDSLSRISSISNDLNQATANAQGLADNITKAAENVERLNATTKETAVDYSDIQTIFDNSFKTTTVKEMEEAIKQLKIARDNMSSQDYSEEGYANNLNILNDRISELTQSVKEARMDSTQLAEAHKKAEMAAQKQELAEKRLNEQLKRQAAREAAQENTKLYSTYSGSLQFAETASSINERTQAIKYLTAARNELNVADEDYSAKLSTLNAKILEMNRANREATAGAKELAKHHRNLLDISGQLARAFALIFSVSQIRGYISEMIKVRGEFELQQRSLEAILQDKPKADEIFNKTVQLAVQSPFQIRELVTYTKQLAAFRIESDKLYDTTKRLSDISAGLGVSMDRIILAYGQVKAAAFLRGQEVRQFTEAGINLYAELQKYYEEVRGEAYTTAQIVEMISKRMVTFEDVDAVFHRLTDEGGIFYRMQEIQAETLRGRIANLKDSFDIMLNSIGKSNEGILKGGIDVTKSLLQNWEKVVTVIEVLGGLLLMLKVRSMQTGVAMSKMFTQEFLNASRSEWKNLEMMHYHLGLVREGCNKAWIAVKNFGRSLISAFASNLPLLGLTAIIGALTSAYGWWRKNQESVQALAKTYGENMQPVYKLASAYNDLKNAADKAAKSQDKVFDFNANTEDRRQLLRELVGRYRDSGFEINLDVSTVSDEDLDKVFKEYTDRFEEIERHIRSVGAIFNDVDNNFWEWVNVFNDSLNSDAKDLANAETNLLLQENNIKSAINLLGASYNELNNKAKDYFDTIKDGQKSTENYTEYMYRAYNVMTEIQKSINSNSELYGNLSDYLSPAYSSANSFYYMEKEFLREVDKIKKKIEKAGIDDPVAIRAEIDRYAAENSWSNTATYLAKKAILGVKVELDTEGTAEQIKSIKQQMDEAFANKSYNITFLSNGLDSEAAFKEFDDNAQAYIKKLKKLISQRDHALKATSRLDNYDALQNAQDINDTVKQLIDWGYGDEVDAILNGKKKAAKAAKGAERDIWQERINVLKEMNKQYNDLRKTMSEKDARQYVLQEYRNAAQYAGMFDVIDYSTLMPTDKNVADIIDKWKELVAKANSRLSAEKDVANLRIGIDEEYFKKELARIEKDVDEAFNGLSLTEKLTGVGLHDYQIKMMFPDIAVSFDQVAKRIRDDYEITEEMASMTNEELEKMMGTDKFKAYNSAVEKLDQQRVNQQRSTIEQLVKNYKNVLDEQVKLDVWYTKERNKIYENISDPFMQSDMFRNLDKQYQQQSQKIAWDDFTNSGFYTLMFSQIEYASKTSLELMRKKLEEIRKSMGNLDPENLKQIADLEKKIGEREVDLRPWHTLVSTFKDAVTALRERKQLEEELRGLVVEEDELRQQQSYYANLVQIWQNEMDKVIALKDLEGGLSDEMQTYYFYVQQCLDYFQKMLGIVNDDLDKNKDAQEENTEKTKKNEEALRSFMDSWKKFNEHMGEIIETMQVLADEWDQIFGTGSDWLHDFFDTTLDCANGLMKISEGMEKIADPAEDSFSGVTSAVQGAISVVSALFAIKDKRLERQIQKLQEETDNLAKSYERLKDAMDDAYDISRLQTYRNETVKTLKAEIANYEEMIRLENEKKKTDKDKIKEYQEEIEDLYDTLQELEESFIESLGGFGTEANYKSAAEGFADAWVSAFRDSENALDALNEEFEDLFANLLQTQLTNRLAEAYIQPILDAMDNALVDENGNARDLNTMVKMLADAWAGIDEAAEGYNAAATQIMDLLKDYGIDLTSGSSTSELSALQQGIEGVSEQTASALESILNSIRFFVAEQQADVAIIREYLVSSSVSGQTTESPMLIELQSQTAILRDMRTMWDRVIKPQTGGGYGVKVLGIS